MIANDTNLSGNWGDIVENKMPHGQQMLVATLPEIDYQIVMQSCSDKLHEIAIMASMSKDPQMLEMCAYQKRHWTYWRAKAAQMFMTSGEYTDITDSIYELQMTIDMASEMNNKEAVAEALPKIISMRKLVARITKHAKDLEKMKAE